MIKKTIANKFNSPVNTIKNFNNKQHFNKIITVLLISLCFVIILNPKVYTSACFSAISVWAVNVFPSLFPFFVLTKIIISLFSFSQTRLDKLFYKVYHTPATSSKVFFLSCLAGYPMGAKLIANMYDADIYTKSDAKKMLAFCSVSGPMFIIGTVGVAFLKSYKAGVVILISNLLACLVNGLLYRGKSLPNSIKTPQQTKTTSMADCVYDSIISILTVGAYIVISFLIIEILNQFGIFNSLATFFTNCFHFNFDSCKSVLMGFAEITKGILELSKSTIPLATKTCISSGLIGFGGISIFMQSIAFLDKLNINKFYVLLQKITQGILSFSISFILCLMFM